MDRCSPMWSKCWSLPGTAPGPCPRLVPLLLKWGRILQGKSETCSWTQEVPHSQA